MLLLRRKKSFLTQAVNRYDLFSFNFIFFLYTYINIFKLYLYFYRCLNMAPEETTNIIVAYGNMSTTNRSKKYVPKILLKQTFDACSNNFKKNKKIKKNIYILYTDEFRTSMLCHLCSKKLKNIYRCKNNIVHVCNSSCLISLRGSKRCDNCHESNSLEFLKLNRDKNAACNILFKCICFIHNISLPECYDRNITIE